MLIGDRMVTMIGIGIVWAKTLMVLMGASKMKREESG